MRVKSLPYIAAGLSLCFALTAHADEAAPQVHELRQYFGFETDAETNRGLWMEVGGSYASEDDLPPDLQKYSAFLRLAYGGDKWEAGMTLPYVNFDQETVRGQDGLGNMVLYGKFLPVRTEKATFGGGLTVEVPTGTFEPRDAANAPLPGEFDNDEATFEPFLTAAFQCGRFSFRPHLGYGASTDSDLNELRWSNAILFSLGEIADLRTEITGSWAHEAPSNEDTEVMVLPGVDLRTVD